MIRMSSLGDVILSTAALTAKIQNDRSSEITWLTSKGYEGLFQNDDRVSHVWHFDRSKTSIAALWKLAARVASEHFHEVIDLHSSLRTNILRIFTAFHSPQLLLRWSRISKQRIRRYGRCVFKSRWPLAFLPEPWVIRYARAGGDPSGQARPNLSHLLSKSDKSARPPTWAVMPDSKWEGKNWPTRQYVDLLEKLGGTVIIVGTKNDQASQRLISELRASGIPVVDGTGLDSFANIANAIRGVRALISGDTGFAHFAEALGIPVRVIYGPTHPQLGFAPWRTTSQALLPKHISCSPCGKDGSRCYRVTRRRACMTELSAEAVLIQMNRGEQPWRIGAYSPIEN